VIYICYFDRKHLEKNPKKNNKDSNININSPSEILPEGFHFFFFIFIFSFNIILFYFIYLLLYLFLLLLKP
jgi:hypothetical protein